SADQHDHGTEEHKDPPQGLGRKHAVLLIAEAGGGRASGEEQPALDPRPARPAPRHVARGLGIRHATYPQEKSHDERDEYQNAGQGDFHREGETAFLLRCGAPVQTPSPARMDEFARSSPRSPRGNSMESHGAAP